MAIREKLREIVSRRHVALALRATHLTALAAVSFVMLWPRKYVEEYVPASIQAKDIAIHVACFAVLSALGVLAYCRGGSRESKGEARHGGEGRRTSSTPAKGRQTSAAPAPGMDRGSVAATGGRAAIFARAAKIALATASYGALMECLQLMPAINRAFQWKDIADNLVGSILGAALALLAL